MMATPTKPRRQTVGSLPPPNPLGLPEPVLGANGRDMRPPSPLRHELSHDGDSDDDDADAQSVARPPSFAGYAANLARSVGSLMSPARSMQSLPSDAELEAEAERERDRSRREAEWILRREAEDRRRMEERVLAMLQTDGGDDSALPPPPSLSHSTSNPSSPSNSQKDAGWWSAAKAKLTPTKDPLTPAQQVVQEMKHRDKAQKRAEKAAEKAEKAAEKADRKARENQWPSNKFNDPAFMALASAQAQNQAQPNAGPSSGFNPDVYNTPVTPPAPPKRQFSTPASLAASPAPGANGAPAPLMYASWTEEGTLDVHDTLLIIAKRFEKLEKWTVGHVRALEERMGDVERWLVDKEREREEAALIRGEQAGANGDMMEVMEGMRDEMAELQGRIGVLGREMAKMAAAPSLSRTMSENNAEHSRRASAPSAQPAPSSSAFSVHVQPNVIRTPSTTRSSSQAQATSPPPTTPGATSSRTRLPYPTGDYASPPVATNLTGNSFTPANSPPPTQGMSPVITGLPRTESPTPGATTSHGLPMPNAPALRQQRQGSVSPTPRKRYTVALGASITGGNASEDSEREQQQQQQQQTPMHAPRARSHSRSASRIETAFFVDSPAVTDAEADEEDGGGETIGRSASRRVAPARPQSAVEETTTSSSLSKSEFQQKRAMRTQSVYAFGSSGPASSGNESDGSSTAPLRFRSRSNERLKQSTSMSSLGIGLGAADGSGGGSAGGSRFVDPYVVRREERERERSAAPPAPKVMAGKKVPVGQLVAFFDKDKDNKGGR